MLSIHDLSCEHTRNPLGLETRTPRFSWKLSSERRSTVQAGYRIRIAATPEGLDRTEFLTWDSGRVDSDCSVLREYEGPALASRQRLYWDVTAWDNHGQEARSDGASWFETALRWPDDWSAEWIGSPASWCGAGLLFHCRFELAKPIRLARLYAAGLGYAEYHLNGKRIGDASLQTEPTTFSKRVLYTTFDVTDHLAAGTNVIGAMLGNGWYGMPKLLLQLELLDDDGRRTTIATGNDPSLRWEVAPGPQTANSIYGGESYDARLERPGWDHPGGEDGPPAARDRRWRHAVVVDPPGGRLVAQEHEPVRVTQTIRPKSLSQPRPGTWVYDLGQNIAGWARLHVRGDSGSRIILRYAESLRDDGTLNQDNLRSADCVDSYTCRGGDAEEWEPRFTYHGFRYVQVEGFPGEPSLSSIDGRVVCSDLPRRGSFTCTNPLINRIQECIEWTERDNQHGIPTDCPQRDERMGWLNDMTARAEELVYNFESARFLAKWLDDICDVQDPRTGAIPDTAPFHWGNRPADPVSISLLLLPWLLYTHYHDERILDRHYDAMRRWVQCLLDLAEGDVLKFSKWGDWSPPIHQPGQEEMGTNPVNANAPGEVVSTGFLQYHARLLSRIARTLGKVADGDHYQRIADRIRSRFHATFWNDEAGEYATGGQSCNSLALYLGLVPDHLVPRVVKSLHRSVEKRGYHLSTGNICTKYLLEALTDNGLAESAFRIATQRTYPSWGYMIDHGATTIWERWEDATGSGMNSHNHPMYCSVGAWFYRALAGIRVDEDNPGFSRFIVKPHPLPSLDHASAELETVRGLVKVGWRKTGPLLTVNVTIPTNSAAVVHLPGPGEARQATVSIDDRVAWKSGETAVAIDGVQSIEVAGTDVVVHLGSGSYVLSRTE